MIWEKYYVILPSRTPFKLEDFIYTFKAIKVPQGFSYNSETNEEWETVETMKALIEEHLGYKL